MLKTIPEYTLAGGLLEMRVTANGFFNGLKNMSSIYFHKDSFSEDLVSLMVSLNKGGKCLFGAG